MSAIASHRLSICPLEYNRIDNFTMPADTQHSTKEKRPDRPRKRNLSQKLRTSCDKCHIAKVKCVPAGMQQGICTRCQSNNVPCIYSPSLRVGKPRGSKNLRQQTVESADLDDDLKSLLARSSPQESTASNSNTVPRGQSHRGEEGMENGLPMSQSWEDEQSRLSMFSLSDFHDQQPVVSMLQDPINSPSNTALSNFSPLDNLWAIWADQNYSNSTGTPESSEYGQTLHNLQDYLGNLGDDTIGEPDSSKTQEGGIGVRSSHQQGTSSSVLQSRATRPSFPGRRASHEETCKTAASKPQCDCLDPILQVLQHPLHKYRRREDKRIAETAALDALLTTNQLSIELCKTALYCSSCFGGSTAFLLLPVLLTRVLAVYISASEAYLVRPKEAAIAPALPIVPGSLRLTLGGYKIADEDEYLLKKELILIELRKVETLLSRYKHLIDTFEDRSETSTYEALLACLTQRLERTVEAIQPRI